MNCQGNVNSTLPTQLPHKFSYIVAILGHNHFESPNICLRNVLKRELRYKYVCFISIKISDYCS
jgi:hypothetical protein